MIPEPPSIEASELKPYLERLRRIYRAMGQAYDQVSAHYGCTCSGCDGNCCSSYFSHHTLIEYFFLAEGLKSVTAGEADVFRTRSRHYVAERARRNAGGMKAEIMCPLNKGGLCGLYEYRPMICRLHGVPFFYIRPDRMMVKGEGCPKLVSKETHQAEGKELDRTWFYRDLAMIERELRQATGFRDRIKMTIADMMVASEL